MKKLVSILLTLVLATGLFAGCSPDEQPAETGNDVKTEDTKKDEGTETKTEETTTEEKKVVKMFQFKVEIAEQLESMKVDLENEKGIILDIETAGGGADYGAMLKAKFAAGDYPDVFNNGGYTELDLWVDKLEDLSNEPWVEYLVPGTEDPMTKDGKLYGMPVNVEGYGYLYNKDLFEQAGITELPDTLSELEAACEKLEAIGITPFSNGYQEWWVLGIHNFNTLVANQEDPDSLIKGLKEGTVDLQSTPFTDNYINMLDLTLKYGQPNSLTVDYNTQVTEFAVGACAMMQQGNWTQVQVSELNPNINVGVLPMPVADTDNKVLVGVPNNWVVYNESPVKDAAKELLNWMVTSETGQKYVVDEFKFIPAFSNFGKVEGLGDIAGSLQEHMAAEAIAGWHWFKFPDGAANEIGAYLQAYIGDSMTKDELLDNIESIMHELANK